MKSPHSPTWLPVHRVTKGGSLISPFSTVPTSRISLHREGAGGGLNVRDLALKSSPGREAENNLPSEGSELPEVPGWKRVFDCVVIGVLLPFWLPIAMGIAGWIKIVSPGPIFYRQARIGRGGRVFNILKFRSMKANAPTSTHEQHLEQLIKSNVPMAKLDGVADPRIIPGGRVLRALGLDELPQLINVLMGEMSLVGPRPSTPNEYALFTEAQKARVGVLPGLTGYWQVSGKNKLTFQQMISLDLHYVGRMCLGLDVAIMLATIPAMFLQFMESRGPAVSEETKSGI